MSIITSPILLGADSGSYQISRSLRFNSADSSYLSRTFGTPTTQGTFTLAMWVKRSILSTTQSLFGVSTNHRFGFTSGDALNLTFGGTSALTTTAVFRDPSAWYHMVWTQSGTSHTVYVNGVSQGTATATSNVFNTAVAHQLGASNTANYFNGYLADVYFIDGQALTPSSFTTTDTTTGQLVPNTYTGSYGTNGFRLSFSNNATTATLGTDTSGNGNTWTVNNLSVTTGVNNDSLVDTPTSYGTDTGAGGSVRGNYATLNPLDNGGLTLANGNLDSSDAVGTFLSTRATIGITAGKWYWEATATSGSIFIIGISKSTAGQGPSNYVGIDANGWSYAYNANKYNNNTGVAYGATYTTGDVIGIAFDADAGTLTFYKNGTTQGQAYSGLTSGPYFPAVSNYSSAWALNFGQRPFAYTAPSGYKALCDTNLPLPVIDKPNTVMDIVLYTGTGAVRSITGLAFNPDLVWIKSRSASSSNKLTDSVRGVTKSLSSDLPDLEATDTGGLTTFNSDGFSLGTDIKYNNTSATYVAWAWDAGSSSAVTNTAGSITSQVKANANAGFSIVSYTGTGANATVGHGLGIAPEFVITKNRTGASGQDWGVYHSALTSASYFLRLNSEQAEAVDATYWNSTAPTSTVFSVGTALQTNRSTNDYIAYCFTSVTGYSAIGKYTGSGTTDGPFIYTGFTPRYILIHIVQVGILREWYIYDTARSTFNPNGTLLFTNLGSSEAASSFYLDILSNGFCLRTTAGAINSGGRYLYAAFASNPLQYARAR